MRDRTTMFGTVLLAAFAAVATAAAQPGALDPAGRPRKQLRAARIQGLAPQLDGRLLEPVWGQAEFVGDFLQKEPNEGAPPTEMTEVGLLYDDAALWIGARLQSKDPLAIRKLVSRRDEPGNTERIIVTLDTYHDRRTAYSFALSVTGVRSDYYHPVDDEYSRDHSYDPVWEGKTHVDSAGWTAEIRIPFSQLRFNHAPQQVWGVTLNRYVPARNEDVFWVYVPRTSKGWSSYFGDLLGIEGIRPSRRLELLPYAASNVALSNDVPPDDPFRSETEVDGRAGADLKMGIGPNLTLDGTVNPDFGQVEADPAEINLTQFETFFEERRPFFIEGSQLLAGSGPGYFYSRRIGAPPSGRAPGTFVDRPKDTTILGAAKLTGRLASGLSVGALAALTDREYARVADSTGTVQDRIEIAPRTGWGVVRLQQEFGREQSTVGLSLTGVSRALEAGDALGNALNRHAYSGGADWLLRFDGGDYELSGFAGFSRVDGAAADILRVQTAPARLFQRPDAGHVSIDTARTSLTGWTAQIGAARVGGAHWLWGGGVSAESPEFELNDAGQLQSADDAGAWAQIRYRETVPGRVFRNYSLGLTTEAGMNFGGVRQYTGIDLEGECTWRNFVSSSAELVRGIGGLSDDHLRGGPLFRLPGYWSGWLDLSGNRAATTQWGVSTAGTRNDIGGWAWDLEGRYGRRFGDHLEATIAPVYERSTAKRQYVATRDGGPEATFGRRYVLARLDASTARLQLRGTYAFTPDLTLEFYAEPFASTGRWNDFGELRAARTHDLRLYGTEGTTIERAPNDDLTITDGADTLFIPHQEYRGDFKALSYRSSFVLRWEWRRGSTLFFIWQADRSEFLQSRELVQVGDLWDAFTSQGGDLLAVKATYWFSFD